MLFVSQVKWPLIFQVKFGPFIFFSEFIKGQFIHCFMHGNMPLTNLCILFWRGDTFALIKKLLIFFCLLNATIGGLGKFFLKLEKQGRYAPLYSSPCRGLVVGLSAHIFRACSPGFGACGPCFWACGPLFKNGPFFNFFFFVTFFLAIF